MKKLYPMIILALLLSLIAGCAPKPDATPTVIPTEAPTETTSGGLAPGEMPLYINLTWHQHQPLYYKNEENLYTRPWVRAHATKDYLDMVETIAAHPGMKATINLTPVLLRQLDDYTENGAKDLYWYLAEKPAAQLSPEDQTFILQRFFDANWEHIIGVHPRYKELLDKRPGTDEFSIAKAMEAYTEADYRDLQVWFNLAWVDPDYLAQPPFKALVEKGRDFSEEDKQVLFNGILDIMKKIVPTHRSLQEAGVLELITTPYAHPILPLIYNSDLALVGNPKAIMPNETFSYPEDSREQVQKSVEIYKEHFGKAPAGLWPGEGSVAEDIVPLVSEAGYRYMQTGEPVLVASLGLSGDRFPRDGSDTVIDGDTLYRPYYVQGASGEKVAVFFRDWVISDKIGFTYSGMKGKDAAADMIARLERIRTSLQGKEGPHIVTLVIDGENAWENYDNDGKEFLNTLYDLLAKSQTLEPITPSEYLALYPEQRELEALFPGAWFSANYDTWIGESEEAEAWNLLGRVRKDLQAYEDGTKTATPEALAQAKDFMLLAEGSDWFWWYGTDQDSGQDSYFDQGYRALLMKVYTSLGEEVPAYLNIPVLQATPVKPTQALRSESSPVVDGLSNDTEWEKAALYKGKARDTLSELYYAMDQETLYLRLGTKTPLTTPVEIYLNLREEGERMMASSEGTSLSMPANLMLRYTPGDKTLSLYRNDGTAWTRSEQIGLAEAKDSLAELSLPLATLGTLENGQVLPFTILVTGLEGRLFPIGAPAALQYMSFKPLSMIYSAEDPQGDDNGIGSYTYPTDGAFKAGDFDLTGFEMASDGANYVFTMMLNVPISNSWNSPNGFSVQTFDIYIDQDPSAGTGARMLLPGRNASLAEGYGWDLALWVEGWNSQLLRLDEKGLPANDTVASSAMRLWVDNGRNAVVLSVPKEFFGTSDPQTWALCVVLLGQEGYPADGVWRVRDVNQQKEAYRFGGAPADNNHTRIIDLLWPSTLEGTQSDYLGKYPSSAGPIDGKGPEHFAQLPMISLGAKP